MGVREAGNMGAWACITRRTRWRSTASSSISELLESKPRERLFVLILVFVLVLVKVFVLVLVMVHVLVHNIRNWTV